MGTYVFVHGSFHGGWCWEHVGPLLAGHGHRVRAPDLPGHGADRTPQADITYGMAVDRIRGVVEEASEPVLLVGHSMAGLLISKVADLVPDRVRALVWIAGFLCPSGYSVSRYLQDNRGLGLSQVPLNAVPSADGSHAVFDVAKAGEVFYNTTPDDRAAAAVPRLGPAATVYTHTPVEWSPDRFGRVPRAYAMCLQDRCIPPAMQDKMIADLPCRTVFRYDADHSPFLSCPEALARDLLTLA